MSAVALLVKILFLFPKLEGLLRRSFYEYERQQYLKRHRVYDDVIDAWVDAIDERVRDASDDGDENPAVLGGVEDAPVLRRGEADDRGDASLHQRP